MNERTRAIGILHQVRENLLDRLADRIVQGEEQLIEESNELLFGTEIDAIYEQLGLKLNHVNAMLALIPPDPSVEETPVPISAMMHLPGPMDDAQGEELTIDVNAGNAPALTISTHIVESAAETTLAFTWAGLSKALTARDTAQVSQHLAELMGLDAHVSHRLAQALLERHAANPAILDTLLGLKDELAAGSMNSALVSLWECFGLQGLESAQLVDRLRPGKRE